MWWPSKYLLSFSLLLNAHLGFASVAPPAPLASQNPLTAHLAPYLKTIKRDLWTYHFSPRTTLGIPSKGPVDSKTDMSHFIELGVDAFEDTSLPQDPALAMGRGLYLANDPLESRKFGKTNWALLEITLKPGTRYLDLRNGADYSEVDAGRGCPKLVFEFFKSSGPCRKLLIDALKELRVDAIAYEWWQFRAQFAPCNPHRMYSAFLLTNRKLKSTPTRLFVSEFPDHDSALEDRIFINSIYARAHSPWDPLWPELLGKKEPLDFSNTVHAKLFGCGETKEDLASEI